MVISYIQLLLCLQFLWQTAGGFIGLALTDKFIEPQPLDVLTMLGFIILVGIVVNNAILIVHQALNLIREEGYEHKRAVSWSYKNKN